MSTIKRLSSSTRWLVANAVTKAMGSWPLNRVACPQQVNGYDCGVFLVGFVQAIAGGGLAAVQRFNQSKCLQLRSDMLHRAVIPVD